MAGTTRMVGSNTKCDPIRIQLLKHSTFPAILWSILRVACVLRWYCCGVALSCCLFTFVSVDASVLELMLVGFIRCTDYSILPLYTGMLVVLSRHFQLETNKDWLFIILWFVHPSLCSSIKCPGSLVVVAFVYSNAANPQISYFPVVRVLCLS